jgi:hypothetical protein
MNLQFSLEILAAFGSARDSFARAEERLALAPEPAILIAHVRAAEQDALAWLEGESFIPDQLAVDYGYSPRAWRNWPFTFVRVFDRPLPASRAPDAAMVEAWLNPTTPGTPVPDAWRTQPLAVSRDRLGAWERRAKAPSTLPRIIAAADLAAHFARAAPLVRGNAVIGAMLAERRALGDSRLTAGGLTAIGMKDRQVPWRALLQGNTDDDLDETSERARDDRCRLAWLEALAHGAQAVVSLDKRLRLWLAQLDAVCARRRKSSHLRALALLAGAGPSLTVARAAKSLQLSRQATTRLVAEACATHLLREITHGNAFRRYVIAA